MSIELERDVEQYLIRRAEKLGGVCVKIGVDGWPDRLVILPGVVLWCELKRHNGRASALQVYRAEMLRQLGQTVYFPRSKADVDQILGK